MQLLLLLIFMAVIVLCFSFLFKSVPVCQTLGGLLLSLRSEAGLLARQLDVYQH